MNKKIAEDQREFSRVAIEIKATLQAKGEEIISTGTHDISMKGLLVKGKTNWPIGTECDVRLILEGQSTPVSFEVKGKVQRIAKEAIGVLFTEVGLEAYEHLYNLVMLNTDDPEKVEQEFDRHLGLRKK